MRTDRGTFSRSAQLPHLLPPDDGRPSRPYPPRRLVAKRTRDTTPRQGSCVPTAPRSINYLNRSATSTAHRGIITRPTLPDSAITGCLTASSTCSIGRSTPTNEAVRAYPVQSMHDVQRRHSSHASHYRVAQLRTIATHSGLYLRSGVPINEYCPTPSWPPTGTRGTCSLMRRSSCQALAGGVRGILEEAVRACSCYKKS